MGSFSWLKQKVKKLNQDTQINRECKTCGQVLRRHRFSFSRFREILERKRAVVSESDPKPLNFSNGLGKIEVDDEGRLKIEANGNRLV